MKKKVWDHALGILLPSANKILLKMKLTLCIILFSFLGAFASESYSQTTKLTLELKNSTVRNALGAIENQSEFFFLYSEKIVDVNREVNIEVHGSTIEKILDKIFAGTNVYYTVKGRQIVLTTPEASLFETSSVTEQQKSVSGKVTDSSGSPLPGVSVVVKGTTNGTITDGNGNYSLPNVPENATLQYSFVGMKGQEVVVGGKTTISVILKEESIGIEEVVAIGYGTVKRGDLTGSVSQLNVDKFERVTTTNPLQALQGRIAGLSVTPTSGQPGAGSSVKIHGTQSINGTNSPIYVVDGTISESIDNINTQDIETLTVLKDASAVAIYGSRAANGVILVTTKRGTKSKVPTISFSSRQSVQQESNLKVDYVNADQWLELVTEAYTNSGQSIKWTEADLTNYKGVDVNWPKAVMQTGFLSSYDLSVESGGDKSNYLVSAGYLDNTGIIKGQDYKRFNFRINTDHKINKVISFGNSLNIFSSNQRSNTDIDGRNVYTAAFRYTPLNRQYEDNGDFGTIRNSNIEGRSPSPLWMLSNSALGNKAKGLSGNIYLTFDILKGLKMTTRGSLEWTNRDRNTFIGAMSPHYGMEGSNVNSIQKENMQTAHWIGDFLLDYNKTFFENHTISVLLGYSLEDQTYENLRGKRGGTPNNEIRYLDAGDPLTSVNANSFSEWSFVSTFGRLNYSFMDKYYLSGVVRRDGTSRLATGNKYGTFPSVSAAWRITKENFMSNLNWLNELKLRASYGTIGNILSIDTYGTTSTLTQWNSIMNQQPVVGYTLANAVNTDLTWESTTKKNLGLDAYLFDSKFYIVSDFYIEDTKDLLFKQPLPYSTGLAGSPFINAGHIRNTGFDLELGYRKTVGDWKYDVSVNLSHIKNEAIDLDGRDMRTNGIEIGHPLFTAFGYKTNGIIRTDADLKNNPQYAGKQIGDIWFLDIDGYDAKGKLTGTPDGKVDAADRTLIGSVYPDLTFGAFGSISYKDLTLQVQIQGLSGVDRDIRGGRATDMFAGEPNVEADYILDRFHPTKNANGQYPRVSIDDKGQNGSLSDFWLRDASYLSIRNVNLNYDLPSEIIKKAGLYKLSIFGSVQNLYTFTSFYGTGMDVNFDPGLDSNQTIKNTNNEGSNNMTSIPVPRTWTIGLKATF
ncbi:MAG: SusC/RagA family TonB-linked outer membrane protein [Bacteroidetes bacterium GWB2_41_8]|nr:MAG: SusC/RagA family TonB-linked outer membrane protein [Bacteroidetes bacterium GWB2_41_8]